MTWRNTWWKNGLYLAGITLVMNLIIRAIWWSDEPLLSWNVPLAVAVGFLMGCAFWPLQRRYLENVARLQGLRDELSTLELEIEQMRLRAQQRNEAQAMKLIADFLKHPETGVRMERPKRRSDHNSLESGIDITIEEK